MIGRVAQGNTGRAWSSLPRRMVVIVGVPVAVQIVTLIALGLQVEHERNEHVAEVRSRRLTLAASRLGTLLLDLETGVRGYALTHDESFAQPFFKARAAVPFEIERLEQLSGAERAPDPSDIIRHARIVLAHQERVDALLRSNRSAEAMEMIRRGDGKVRMDAYRAAQERFIAAQTQFSARRREAVVQAQRRSSALLIVGSGVTLTLAVTVAIYFVRSIVMRIGVVVDNTSRLAAGKQLREMLDGGDEIAVLDERFHQMADSLERSRMELEEANRNLEAFSYSVSHDLRAPLRAISGYAQMLEEDCASALGATGMRYTGVIRSEAQRLGMLIDDLLMLSRLGRGDLSLMPLDIAALARDVFAEVARGTSLTLEVEDHLPPAMGDRILVRQVLVNLLGNAVKFSRGAENPVIELGASDDGALITYSIRDYGVGFDPRYADKLFGVFQRLHANEDFEGTGVGLAIVKRVIRRLGGDVHAESQPGKGATFFFTLPAAGKESNG